MALRKSKTRKRRDYESQKNRGWYRMYRGWQDHPVFGNEPFSKREVWEWLIATAVFSHDGKLTVLAGSQVLIMRGQLTYSYRFMAEAWGWDDSKVDRYLKKLQRSGMIEINTEMGQSIITICNYETYQSDGNSTETVNEMPPRERQGKSGANNKKDNKDKNVLTGSSALRADAHASPPPLKNLAPWQAELKECLGEAVYRSWISQLRLDNDGYLCAPSRFIADWCKNHHEETIKRALQKAGIEFMGFRFEEKK